MQKRKSKIQKITSRNAKKKQKTINHQRKTNDNIRWLPYIIIPILGLLIYSGIFTNSFHFDDLVWRNLKAVKQFDIGGLFEFAHLRFITFFTFSLNYLIGGQSPEGYYIVNLLIHIINSLLVYKLVFLILSYQLTSKLTDKQSIYYLSFIAALIFLCHPIQTQAVSYIYQRLASLAAMFYFSSMLFFLKGYFPTQINRQLSASQNLTSSMKYYILSLLFLVFALFTKENSFSIFGIFLVVLIFFPFKLSKTLNPSQNLTTEKQSKINKSSKLIYTAIAGIAMIAGLILFTETDVFNNIYKTEQNYKGEVINNVSYALTQPKVVLEYIRLILLPYGQSVDHDVAIEYSFFRASVIVPLIVHIIIIVAGFWLFGKSSKSKDSIFFKNGILKILSFSIFWFYITLFIESSFIPIRDVMFEHRLYLPMFGFSLFLPIFIFSIVNKISSLAKSESFNPFLTVSIVVILLYSLLSFNRNKVWENNITLWSDVIEKYTQNARAYHARGTAYMREANYSASLKDFNRAIEIYPEIDQAYANRGNLYFKMGNYREAINNFTSAIKFKKESQYFYNRGNAYLKIHFADSAIRDYSRCIRLDPKMKYAYIHRADARIIKSKDSIFAKVGIVSLLKAAAKDLWKALKLDSNNLEANIKLGEVYFNLGKYSDAIARYNRILKIFPGSKEALNNRATAYFQTGDYDKAMSDYKKVISMAPGFLQAYKNLGLVYEKINDFNLALGTYNQALNVNKNDYELYYLRGNLHIKMNEKDKAIEDYNNSLAINPNYQKAIDKLSNLVKVASGQG